MKAFLRYCLTVTVLGVLSAVLAGGECAAQAAAGGSSGAQARASQSEAAPHPLSLHACMAYAVSHSTQVRISQSKTEDTRLDRRNAILQAFTPSIDAGTSGYYRWGRSIDPETNTYMTVTSLNNSMAVSAGITLFDGFSAINNIRISKTALSMGLSQEQQEMDKVCLATMEAFFNVLYYSKLSEIFAEQVANAQTMVTLAERQEQLGAKSHADVVQMRADLADREYELISSRNSLSDALITLQDVMFWPVDEPLNIDTCLSSLESPAALAETEAVVAFAREHQPSVLTAKGERDNAALSLNTAKWRFLPTLNLYGGWSTSYYTYPNLEGYSTVPYWSQFRNNGGEYLQLSLSFPIYDRLSKVSQVSKKKSAYQRASLAYDQARRDVEAEVRRAVQDRDGAAMALTQAERRAQAQDEVWRLNARRFEQGLISSIEYNTAAGNYLKAKAESLNAQLKYQLKRRVVDYYNGNSYLDQQ